ncbi:hypothetical protein EXE49_10705 [Halorubrum sp. ASP121]|uniref:hypothetical protein n=1 Tax=Halorubrum sp. ASP121 TaxID=1855858 RepID=UPI0010F7D17E|nr:hypothetical protein [Halorubrum sp. ASP121]TKX49547.1 hypothetical protein EXE49_10705 [Halorubrum sp. ASP121]
MGRDTIGTGSHGQPIKRGLTGLTPFQEIGYSGHSNWFSETQDAGVAPAVLAQSGLLSCLDEFMNTCVGSRFDAVESGFVRGRQDIDGLEDVFSATVLSLFIPIQQATQTDWQSIYTFGREALVDTISTATPDSEQRSVHSHSLIVTNVDTESEETAILFQVTPLGAIWIVAESSQTGPAVKPLLEASRQEITTGHREHRQENSAVDADGTGETVSTSSSLLPEPHSISPKPIHQLVAASEGHAD